MINKSKFSAPTHLNHFVTYQHEAYFNDLMEIEWRGQIQSSTQNKRFKIKYYGELFEEYQLICGTDFAPELIYAVDIDSNEEILLFDGARHGYDPMFCDEFTNEQLTNRPLIHEYKDQDDQTVFNVIVKVYHNIDYNDIEEVESLANPVGEIELISGEIISVDQLKANAFDFIQIMVVNSLGNLYRIFERELA
ncbi:hypothetical protein RFY44_05050 [Acinetobacter bereziniae]|jgi:hypothetical protein|uniref:hypothetical protein n=1 Tax=Acinetobacter bereziniae TaxID=106648 RepID=UPI00125FC312|nr:hypothetical protein [Acinetobacter bereziniae]MDM1784082.1 hypothetical protein [Acinetobacter bereziniae]MDQ9818247.1 hypothetical protein [Acinetobacter bereziniae]